MNKKRQIDFGWGKTKPIKIQKIKIDKFHITKAGDRTLTPAQKRNLKEEAGNRCSRCHKKFDSRLLEIHHKKSIASHKNKLIGVDLPVYSMGKKYIPKYDRHKSNLEVVCVYCHDKTKKKRKSKNKTNSLYGISYNPKSLFG
jgi:cytochrome c553